MPNIKSKPLELEENEYLFEVESEWKDVIYNIDIEMLGSDFNGGFDELCEIALRYEHELHEVGYTGIIISPVENANNSHTDFSELDENNEVWDYTLASFQKYFM
jgi:hypothetical protein